MVLNKCGVSPVVATALLLVVAVVGVVGFQTWFGSFSSNVLAGVEEDSSGALQRTNIETIMEDQLYFNNGNSGNVSIKSVKIGDKLCNLTNVSVGTSVQNFSLKNCTRNLTTDYYEVVIVTDSEIISRTLYVREMLPAPIPNTVSILSPANSGSFPSVVLGTNGFPLIAHKVNTNNDLQIISCGSVDCSSGNNITNHTSPNNDGTLPTILIGSDSLPVLSMTDSSTWDIVAVHCTNSRCTSFNAWTLTGDFAVSSLAINPATGFPLISVRVWPSSSDLGVIKCNSVDCTAGFNYYPVDTAGDVGQRSKILIGSDNLPFIVYINSVSQLRTAHCSTSSCDGGISINSHDSVYDANTVPTAILGSDGLPIIFYNNDTAVKALHCGNSLCSSGNVFNVVANGTFNPYRDSVTLGPDGFPIYVYSDNMDLKVLKCGNIFCNESNVISTVATQALNSESGVVIGSDNLPFIVYRDSVNLDLRGIHCSTLNCSIVS